MSAAAAGPIPFDVVVVAAGESRRMGGRDKLRAEVAGRPVLAWTLDALAGAPGVERLVLVAPPARVAELAAAPWLPAPVVAVVAGGPRRQESVAAGIAALPPAGGPGRVVLVHDGARPLVSAALVAAVVAAAAEHGAAIPVLPVAETLKRVDGARVAATVNRTLLAAAQTPQGVRRTLLERAWDRYPPGGPDTWTDEAALLEACGIPVRAIPGESTNLKVTLPDDLDRVVAALRGREAAGARTGARSRARASAGGRGPGGPVALADIAAAGVPVASGLRIGLGEDGHPFGPGEPLALGGLTFAGAPRLHGHSDGDVALHAVCDALLGAAGLGDLGRLFPADARTPAGIASRELVAEVARRVAAAGCRPASIDVVIVAARPRLADRLPEMGAAIASLLGLPADRVNVKASTGNLAGMEGAGRGISARAIALLAPADAAAPEGGGDPAAPAGPTGTRR